MRTRALGQVDSRLAAPFNPWSLGALSSSQDSPTAPYLHSSLPKGKGVWGLWIWEWGNGGALDSFLPALSQAWTQARGFLPLAQTTPAARRPPFSFPPAPRPWAYRAPELPAAAPDLLARGPGRGAPGEGFLEFRLASAADARRLVARSERTAGGGSPRPAVMDGARSGARKAIYGARAHRDRFGPAE